MNNVLRLTSPIPVSVNHYLSYRAIIKNKKPMAISYKTKEAITYQKNFTEYVKKEVLKQGFVGGLDIYQHYYVDMIFYFPRKDMDCNNYEKCLFDAITDSKCVWVDDNCSLERVQHIYYDSKNPRIELTIYPVDYKGIFDNKECLDKFESKCKTCTRFKRNCSIYKKALLGDIQEDISDDYICNKFKNIK